MNLVMFWLYGIYRVQSCAQLLSTDLFFKHCRYFLHGQKMCMCLRYNIQINFLHCFGIVNLVIFQLFNVYKAILHFIQGKYLHSSYCCHFSIKVPHPFCKEFQPIIQQFMKAGDINLFSLLVLIFFFFFFFLLILNKSQILWYKGIFMPL